MCHRDPNQRPSSLIDTGCAGTPSWSRPGRVQLHGKGNRLCCYEIGQTIDREGFCPKEPEKGIQVQMETAVHAAGHKITLCLGGRLTRVAECTNLLAISAGKRGATLPQSCCQSTDPGIIDNFKG